MIPRVRGHPAVAEVARVFDGQDVAVVPRTLLTDARWLPTPPRPDRASLDGTRYFLQWLFRGTEGALETRAIRTKGRTDGKKVECRFWRLGHLQELGRYCDVTRTHRDLYFGVATRQDATSGELTNCVHLPALFVDIDFKAIDEAEARERLARYPRPPSATIASGGGLHVYWRFPTPIDLRTDAARAKLMLRRLADELGGDLAAAEPARILRLPRTVNHKYDPPRPVTLEFLK